jgi:hypothetical protein
MHRRTSTRIVMAMLTLALLLVAASQQACYQRVVGVRGLGGSTYDVSEPYQQNSKIDDWVFGERRDPNDKIKPPPAPRD